jgi:polysaccharide deacetylase
LTFDDGPSPKTTPGLLEILKKNNVKATFFVLGKNVSAHPEIVQKEIEE